MEELNKTESYLSNNPKQPPDPTVSEDLSHSETVEVNKFLALQDRTDNTKDPNRTDNTKESDRTDDTKESDRTDDTKESDRTDNAAFFGDKRFQPQLKLLEQQNKKRYIMAKQEQEQYNLATDKASVEATA